MVSWTDGSQLSACIWPRRLPFQQCFSIQNPLGFPSYLPLAYVLRYLVLLYNLNFLHLLLLEERKLHHSVASFRAPCPSTLPPATSVIISNKVPSHRSQQLLQLTCWGCGSSVLGLQRVRMVFFLDDFLRNLCAPGKQFPKTLHGFYWNKQTNKQIFPIQFLNCFSSLGCLTHPSGLNSNLASFRKACQSPPNASALFLLSMPTCT